MYIINRLFHVVFQIRCISHLVKSENHIFTRCVATREKYGFQTPLDEIYIVFEKQHEIVSIYFITVLK